MEMTKKPVYDCTGKSGRSDHQRTGRRCSQISYGIVKVDEQSSIGVHSISRFSLPLCGAIGGWQGPSIRAGKWAGYER